MQITKDSILKRLKRVYPGAGLPSEIDFRIKDNALFLNISGKGVLENMQCDGAAFESWAICIKAAIPEISNVVMSWNEPKYSKTTETERRQRRHYSRFLMRVVSFLASYSWFSILSEHNEEVNRVKVLLESRCLLMNYPKSESKAVVDENKKSEAFLERQLVKNLRENVPLTDHQLPVGLFVDDIKTVNTFTPRGASQIDIWQVEDVTLRVFELKVLGNEKVGIISELMFYANTMYYMKEGIITYPESIVKAKNYRCIRDIHKLIEEGLIHKIEAVFMVSKLHPLFEAIEKAIIEILNDNRFLIRYSVKTMK